MSQTPTTRAPTGCRLGRSALVLAIIGLVLALATPSIARRLDPQQPPGDTGRPSLLKMFNVPQSDVIVPVGGDYTAIIKDKGWLIGLSCITLAFSSVAIGLGLAGVALRENKSLAGSAVVIGAAATAFESDLIIGFVFAFIQRITIAILFFSIVIAIILSLHRRKRNSARRT